MVLTESMAPEPAQTPDPTADNRRRIYLMKDLPPEVVAVAFAKTSRSPDSFDKIAAELTEDQSAKFHEKWVVGYGHASVAEHAVLSIALENVSIFAAKEVEDNRLASYTEKSTRYQVYDPRRVYRPACFDQNPELAKRYDSLVTELLTTYIDWSNRALEFLKSKKPLAPGKSERLWTSRLRSQACDAIRYLLPTATLTNLGWTINARALAGAIRKLTGSPLAEMREIGEEVKAVAYEKVPTLLKYADPDLARGESGRAVAEVFRVATGPPRQGEVPHEVRILRCDQDALPKLCTAVAYANQASDWQAVEREVMSWSAGDQIALLRKALAPLGPHDALPRAFEHVNYLIEITLDYGAWRDVQRHRIGTQTAQELSPDLGYTVPTLIAELNLQSAYEKLIARSAEVYDALHPTFPAEAVYALMLAFHKRSLFDWNLRELHHFVKLRGTAKGHAAYRRVAHDLWRRVLEAQPWLGEILHPLGDDFQP